MKLYKETVGGVGHWVLVTDTGRPMGIVPSDEAIFNDMSTFEVTTEPVYESSREWKVGDIVPACTVVGRAWLGEWEWVSGKVNRLIIQENEHSDYKRKILWIEE